MTTTTATTPDSLADVFDPGNDLAPMLRRLGERPLGAGQADADPGDAAARESIWQLLTDRDAFRAGPAAVEACEAMGSVLYRSPYAGTVTAGTVSPVSAGLVVVPAWTLGDPARPAPLRLDPATGTVTATRRFVPFAADADRLLLIGDTGTGITAVAVRPGGPGVHLRRHDDIGRGDLYAVEVAGAPADGEPIPLGDRFPAVLADARLLQAGYLAGLSRGAIELAAAYLKGRSAFGRKLAAQQALAHRLAALSSRAFAVLALIRDLAGRPAGADRPLRAAQALLLAGELARESAAEAVHLHGAYGLTEQSDAQLFYRRAAVESTLLGTPTALRIEAGRRLAELLTAEKGPQ